MMAAPARGGENRIAGDGEEQGGASGLPPCGLRLEGEMPRATSDPAALIFPRSPRSTQANRLGSPGAGRQLRPTGAGEMSTQGQPGSELEPG
jgi:hypothetical protein